MNYPKYYHETYSNGNKMPFPYMVESICYAVCSMCKLRRDKELPPNCSRIATMVVFCKGCTKDLLQAYDNLGLRPRTKLALWRNGITLEALQYYSDEEILRITGIGKIGLQEIKGKKTEVCPLCNGAGRIEKIVLPNPW